MVVGLVLGFFVWGIYVIGLLEILEMWVRNKKKKLICVYMDGCFDMMYYGYCNVFC